MGRFLRLTLPVGALTLGCALGAGLVGQTIAARVAQERIAAVLRHTSGVEVSRAAVDVLADRVDLSGLTVRTATLEASVGRISLRLPHAPWGLVTAAWAADAQMQADDVTIGTGIDRTTIKHVEADGTTMTAADLAAILDPGSALTVEERLAKLNAKAIRMTGIVSGDPQNADNAHMEMASATITDVHDGHVGGFETSAAVILGGSKPGTMTLAGIRASDLDLGLLRTIATGKRNDAAQPLATLVGDLELSGLALSADDVAIRIGAIHLADLKARPFLTRPSDLAGDVRAPVSAYADVADSLAFHLIETRDIVIKSSSANEPGAMSWQRVGLTDYGHFALANYAMQGLSAQFHQSDKDMSVSAGEIGFSGLSFATLVGHLVALESDPAAARGDTPVYLPELKEILLKDLHTVADIPLEAKTGNPSTYHMDSTLDDLSLRVTESIGTIPTTLAFASHMHSTSRSTMPALAIMRDLKLDNGVVDWHWTLHWDQQAATLALRDFVLQFSAFGEFAANASVRNVTPRVLSTDTEAAQAALDGMVLAPIDLSYTDNGLAGRVVAFAAASQHKTEKQIKATATAEVLKQVRTWFGNTAQAKAVAAAMRAYIADPKSLHVSLTPTSALTMHDLQKITSSAQALKLFAVKVTANR